MTNADRIRSMTDEELAGFIEKCEVGDVDYGQTYCNSNICGKELNCEDCRKWWLNLKYDPEDYFSLPIKERDKSK